ncbi:MAG: EF-hand domain-containing protein [Prochlorotrichaceae cyanobacterium]|jgi:calmodulin
MDMQAIKQVFLEIDTNNNGFLEPEEIRSLMLNAHVDITDEELDEMIKQADVNGDRKIDLKEFKSLLANF